MLNPRALARRLGAAVLGGNCYACGAPAGTAPLCAACAADLPALPDALCPQCALPSPHGQVCGACRRDEPHFDTTTALWHYEFPLREMIVGLKYRAELALAPWFAAQLQARVARPEVDCVIALPLHRERLIERGFNQAVEIARPLARAWELPLLLDALVKDRMVAPQATLKWTERRKNIRGAFRCTRELTGQRVLVIDDVMTTGATLEECARTLKRRGAAAVHNLVLARTYSE